MTNYYPPSSIGPTDVGPYRLVRMIGEGGMGAVYYALRRSDNLAVALKILPRSLAMDNDQLARFRREAAVAMGLDHPNVVGCIDVDQSDGYNFMVMEFVGGGDAEELLRRSGGRISERRAMSISLDITKALHHASSFGLVHRDIKPENLLFTESGMAKLTDFGLVKRTAENLRITERGKAMGTPHFMAPEQARGKRDLDVRSDIYSLGATIYYLLCGQTPYNGNSAFEIVSQLASEPPPPLSSHRPDLSPSCLFIIECMMARELEDRPQSAKDLLVMIEAYFNGRQIPHPRDLTKPEKGSDTPTEGRKGETRNPMKKLKAAEFQATPHGRAPQPGEIPPNTITRHFMTSPTRIMNKGGAAPPPPSPETVSMPTAGMKVPLIKQNEGRRPAPAAPAPTPSTPPAPQPTGLRSASGPMPSPPKVIAPNPYPPQGLPMGIPIGQPFPGQHYPPQAYPPANESGEQIVADTDLDHPLPSLQYPLTPPAGTAAHASSGIGALPQSGRTDTVFLRRSPDPAEVNPYESGELLAEEPSVPALPPEPPPLALPLQVPGPVTSRFRIQAPPPEAYIDSAEAAQSAPLDEAETPPPEAYITDSGAVSAAGEAAGVGEIPGESDAAATADRPLTPSATPSSADSGVATPVDSSESQQPDLATPPEMIERIAMQGSSTITPAVADDAAPAATEAAAADAPTTEAEAETADSATAAAGDTAMAEAAEPAAVDTFDPGASESPAEAAVAPTTAAETGSVDNDDAAEAAASLATAADIASDAETETTAETDPVTVTPPPEMLDTHPAAATAATAENPLDAAVNQAISTATEAVPDGSGAAPMDRPADLTAETAAGVAAIPQSPDGSAIAPVTDAPADGDATGYLAAAATADPKSGAWAESSVIDAPAPMEPPPPDVAAPPLPGGVAAETESTTAGDRADNPPPPTFPAVTIESAPTAGSLAPDSLAAPDAPPVAPPPMPQPGLPESTPPAASVTPALTSTDALPVPAAATAAAAGSDPDSLLARVRRLQSADTMAHAVSPAVGVSATPMDEPAAQHGSAWKYLALGFICGVLITLALVLLLR